MEPSGRLSDEDICLADQVLEFSDSQMYNWPGELLEALRLYPEQVLESTANGKLRRVHRITVPGYYYRDTIEPLIRRLPGAK